MMWSTLRLADLATVSSGGGAPQDADAFSAEGIPFIRAGSLIKLLDGLPEESLELLQPAMAAHHKLKLFPAGTVLFAKSGMSATKGHVYQLKKPAYVVNHLAALIPHSDVAGRYLRQVLKFKSPTCLIKDDAYPSIRLGDIEDMKVPAPKSEVEQKRIAAILDQADELCRIRQRTLDRLTQLGQAIFYEMFGDPDTNDRGWPVVTVGEVSDCIVPGRDKPKSFTGDVPWITTAEIVHLGLTGSEHAEACLSFEEIAHVRARVIPAQSVIMTCVGDLGKVSIADCPMVINQQLHSFQCSELLDPLFLMFMLSHRRSWMLKMATQTTLPYMNKSTCNATPIWLPPISMQRIFAERYLALAQARRLMTRDEQRFSELFRTLQHHAFRGELTASSLTEAAE